MPKFMQRLFAPFVLWRIRRQLRNDEGFEMVRRMNESLRDECATTGHMWRDYVDSRGTICVRCGTLKAAK